MKTKLILIAALLVLVMTACGGSADLTTTAGAGDSVVAQALDETTTDSGETTAESATDASAAIAEQIAGAAPVDALSADYRDALPVESQLAFGTLQLESTDQAVTVEQAEALLPLWQALMSLQASGTAADVELQAVVAQIQGGMTPQQLGAISALELTEENVADLMESGALGFGRGPQGDEAGPGGGFAAGGDFPAGGPPGGGIPGGGGIEGGFDPTAIETRQAEMEAAGAGSLSQQMGPNMVVRLLQSKTGEFEGPGFGGFGQAMMAVSEATGLDAEAIQTAMSEGQTLGQIVEANGGDIDAVREAIVAALEEMPQAEEQDLAAMADELLNSAFPQNPAP